MLRLARCERDTIVELMRHLAEFDRRRLYREAGHSSLFVYCTGPLKLTEHEAYNRMKAARAVRRFPQILDLLADGSLNQTTVRLIARHLTRENLDEVLKAACGKSKREVEELVARLAPRPDVPTRIRALPERGDPAVPPVALDIAHESTHEPTLPLSHPVATVVAAPTAGPLPAGLPADVTAPPPYRPPITPLSPQRYQITFTASAETRDKLEHARDLLRQAIPTGDVSAIMDRALTVLIDALLKKKFAMTDRPRRSQEGKEGSRYVPEVFRYASAGG